MRYSVTVVTTKKVRERWSVNADGPDDACATYNEGILMEEAVVEVIEEPVVETIEMDV